MITVPPPEFYPHFCPRCGAVPSRDEDGCCPQCGATLCDPEVLAAALAAYLKRAAGEELEAVVQDALRPTANCPVGYRWGDGTLYEGPHHDNCPEQFVPVVLAAVAPMVAALTQLLADAEEREAALRAENQRLREVLEQERLSVHGDLAAARERRTDGVERRLALSLHRIFAELLAQPKEDPAP